MENAWLDEAGLNPQDTRHCTTYWPLEHLHRVWLSLHFLTSKPSGTAVLLLRMRKACQGCLPMSAQAGLDIPVPDVAMG